MADEPRKYPSSVEGGDYYGDFNASHIIIFEGVSEIFGYDEPMYVPTDRAPTQEEIEKIKSETHKVFVGEVIWGNPNGTDHAMVSESFYDLVQKAKIHTTCYGDTYTRDHKYNDLELPATRIDVDTSITTAEVRDAYRKNQEED